MHSSVHNWAADVVGRHDLNAGKVLEVGALNVNGSIRDLFPDAEYVGIDMRPGSGVDVVMNAHALGFESASFDTVVCTEMLEHDDAFWLSCAEMGRVLRSGGYLIITVRGNGFPEHGYPEDYWRFMPSSAGLLAKLAGCEIAERMADSGAAGLLLLGRKQ